MPAHAGARAFAFAVARADAGTAAIPRFVPVIARVVAVRVIAGPCLAGARTAGARSHAVAVAIGRAPTGTLHVHRLVAVVVHEVTLGLARSQLRRIGVSFGRAARRERGNHEQTKKTHASPQCNLHAWRRERRHTVEKATHERRSRNAIRLWRTKATCKSHDMQYAQERSSNRARCRGPRSQVSRTTSRAAWHSS